MPKIPRNSMYVPDGDTSIPSPAIQATKIGSSLYIDDALFGRPKEEFIDNMKGLSERIGLAWFTEAVAEYDRRDDESSES